MKPKGLALLCAAACRTAGGDRSQARSNRRRRLTGAGSTFVSPLVSVWTPALGSAFDYTIQYAAVGSGGGIQAITNRSVDFGASDAPLTPDQFTACNGCVQIPWALAGTAIDYNIPGLVVPQEHESVAHGRRDREDLHGPITNWNDPAIKALNPKATIPDLEDHAGLPRRELGHDVQLHRLPVVGQRDLEGAVRHRSVGRTGRRGTGASGNAGVAGVGLEHAGSDRLHRYRVRDREPPALRGDPEPGREVHQPEHPQRRGCRQRRHVGPGEQRAAHRQPAEVAADGVPDRDLHLHHPPDQDGERAPRFGRWCSGR